MKFIEQLLLSLLKSPRMTVFLLPVVFLGHYQKGRSLRCCEMAIDPICKMTIDKKTTKFTSEFKGKKYYFCAPGCKKKFDTDPAKYA
jgi:YHS domain-containing protein